MYYNERYRLYLHTKINFPSTFFGSGGKYTYAIDAPIIFGMPHSIINRISKMNLIGSEGISYSLKKILRNDITKPMFIQYSFKSIEQNSLHSSYNTRAEITRLNRK